MNSDLFYHMIFAMIHKWRPQTIHDTERYEDYKNVNIFGNDKKF